LHDNEACGVAAIGGLPEGATLDAATGEIVWVLASGRRAIAWCA
jgi:hypothetical protein